VETAVGLLLSERPDLVVTDLMMPDLDGTDLIAILQSRPDWRDIPVIVHSQVGDLSRVRTLVDSGVRDYLLKPFDPDVAVPRIRRILAAAPPIEKHAPVAGPPEAPHRVPVVFVTSNPELLEKLPAAVDSVYDILPAPSGPAAVAIAVEVRPWAVCVPGDVAVWDAAKTMKSLRALKGFDKLRVIPLPRCDRDLGAVVEAVQRELQPPPFAVCGDGDEITVTVQETFTVHCADALRTSVERTLAHGSARILFDVPFYDLGSQAVSALHALIRAVSKRDD
jgi:CheY-like chemotaxis protein